MVNIPPSSFATAKVNRPYGGSYANVKTSAGPVRLYNDNPGSVGAGLGGGVSNSVQVEEEVEEEDEPSHAATYSDHYKPKKVQGGHPHPDVVVETSSLSSIEPPDVKYKLKMKVYNEHIVDESAEGMNHVIVNLSQLQVESITYACQMHETFLKNKQRAGFLIGLLSAIFVVAFVVN